MLVEAFTTTPRGVVKACFRPLCIEFKSLSSTGVSFTYLLLETNLQRNQQKVIIAFASGGRVKISSEPGGKQVLVIKDAGLEDEGEYSCKAVSAEGESIHDGELSAEGESSNDGESSAEG